MNFDWLTDYTVRRAAAAPDLSQPFDSADWRDAASILLNYRLPSKENNYHPPVEFRLQYDDKGLYGLFEATEDAIRCVAEKFQDSVCLDTCLECFIEPAGNRGYINFEVNASGILLAMHVIDPVRLPDGGFRNYRYLTEEEIAGFRTFHTMPDRVEPECRIMTTYRLGWFIPFALFTRVTGAPAPHAGDRWRAGVYKCGDQTSKPHHLSWQPLSARNFHLPQHFGNFIFG